MKLRPITPEQQRILVAAAQGRLSFDHRAYRYRIAGEEPPERRARERLQKRGLLSRPSPGNPRILTERGRDALEFAPVLEEQQPEQTSLDEAVSTRA